VLILNWRDTGHPDGGGSEVYAERVADGLASLGHRVTLLTARYAGSTAAETRPSGVRVLRSGGRLGVYSRAAMAVLLRRVPRPDVIIEAQNGIPFFAALWAPRTPRIVLVHHVHREQWPVVFPWLIARVGWWVESWLAPKLNRGSPYVTVSQVSRAELVDLGIDPERIRVVHNGVIPPPARDVPRTTHPQLLVMGRLVPHKRIELAMDVAQRLRREFPTLRLVIAGRGWWESQLRQEIEVREIGDFVHLVGFVSTRDRHRLYAGSWVSLVPSLKEGWGLVVVEAGMNQTPSVAFHGAGGVSESIIDGHTGALAAADDLEDFTRLTRALLLDPGERAEMGRRAAEFAGQFTWADAVGAFNGLIAELTGGGIGTGVGAELADEDLDAVTTATQSVSTTLVEPALD
jgi:glycosyltransferase involved in cell wall biosynthesis